MTTSPASPSDAGSTDALPAAVKPERAPSPPWYGGVTIGVLGVMAVILLSYTLGDWTWQQNLGAWNYVAVIALIPVTSVMMRLWRPDHSGVPGRE